MQETPQRFSWIWHLVVLLAIAIYVGLTVKRARNYISLIGIIVLILLGMISMCDFLCLQYLSFIVIGSKHPHRVGRKWRVGSTNVDISYDYILIAI